MYMIVHTSLIAFWKYIQLELVVLKPPPCLKGSEMADIANVHKRIKLYKGMWSYLQKQGLWNDPQYVQRKARFTTVDDAREIMPWCICQVKCIHVSRLQNSSPFIIPVYRNTTPLPQPYRDTLHVPQDNIRKMAVIIYTYMYLVVWNYVHNPFLEVTTSTITVFHRPI